MPVMSFSSLVSATRWVDTNCSVAQNRDAIRELEDFFQPVRDVDDGNALGLETTYQREELCGLLTRQVGCGFIEDEEPCATRRGASGRNQLLLADGKGGEQMPAAGSLKPISSRIFCASRTISPCCSSPKRTFSSPRKRLAATVRCGQSTTSWCTALMP